MKMIGFVLNGLLVLAFTACSTKGSLHSKKDTLKDKSRKEQSIASKDVKKWTTSSEELSCKMDQDHRRVAIAPTEAGGCQVNYEKFAETKTVAEATNDLSVCGQVRDRIVNNLQQAGFQCENRVAGKEEAKGSH